MTLEQVIKEKIGVLSPGQKKVAEYILQNYESFSYATLAKLSKEIKVSETTIIRLAYSLGFESFSEMQQQVRKHILTEPQQLSEDVLQNGNFYQKVITRELTAIENWVSHIDEAVFDRFVDILVNADQVLVVGARSSFHAANWFGGILRRLRESVDVVQEFYDPRMELLANISEKTVVCCITFARYTKWAFRYCEIAKKRGARVLSVTDSILSPVTEISDEVIVVESFADKMAMNSCVCLYCLFNALIARIQDKKTTDVSSRLKVFEEVYTDLDLFMG